MSKNTGPRDEEPASPSTLSSLAPLRRRVHLHGIIARSLHPEGAVIVDVPGSVPAVSYGEKTGEAGPLMLLPLAAREELSISELRAVSDAFDGGMPHLALMSEDLDIEIRGSLWPGAPGFGAPPLHLKGRRGDLALDGLRTLQHLHVNDAGKVVGILAGSRTILRRHHPVATLILSGDDELAGALEILRELGYQCYDLAGDIAGPGCKELLALHHEGPMSSLELPRRLRQLSMEESLPIVEVRRRDDQRVLSGEIPAWLGGALWRWRWDIMPHQILGDGWHRDEGNRRWGGPEPWSDILLAAPAGGILDVEARVLEFSNPDDAPNLRAIADGTPLPVRIVKHEAVWSANVSIPITEENSRRLNRLRFALPSTQNIDGRWLGFSVERISVAWSPSSDCP